MPNHADRVICMPDVVRWLAAAGLTFREVNLASQVTKKAD
jgi:hypothetical protein